MKREYKELARKMIEKDDRRIARLERAFEKKDIKEADRLTKQFEKELYFGKDKDNWL